MLIWRKIMGLSGFKFLQVLLGLPHKCMKISNIIEEAYLSGKHRLRLRAECLLLVDLFSPMGIALGTYTTKITIELNAKVK